MKKLVVFLTLIVALLLCLASCNHKHSFGEWSVTKNATCTEDGVKTRYCDCGEKQSDVIPATGHKYTKDICVNCGDIQASPECKHESLDVLSAKAATCAENGLTEGIVCLDCKKIIKEQKAINAIGHEEYTYTEKDENCKLFTVIYCERTGCDYIRRIDTGKAEHTSCESVTENNIPASCYGEGSYETVIYCAECGAELERAKHTVPMVSHAPASAVDENVIDSTCFAEGKKDLVVYCSVSECHKELERNIVAIDKKQHTPANAVEENRIEPTYEADGSYEMVVYCSVGKCHAELERMKHTIDMLVHYPGSVVIENNVSATCTKSGSYDEVVYCLDDYCGHKELSRKTITVEKLPHTKSTAVKENELSAKCYAEGSYDEVVYCSVCKTELSRNKVTLAKVEHIPTNAVIENRVEASCTVDGSYDEVVYCGVEKCKSQISRIAKSISSLGHVEVVDPAVGATCTQTGLTEGKHCIVCYEVTVSQIVVNALGHNYGEWTTIKEPSTTEDGLRERCCNCGAIETECIRRIELDYKLNSDETSYSVTGIGTWNTLDIIIPDTYNDLPVTSIADNAFANCSSISSITIGCFITTIGNNAFKNCYNVTDIYFNAIKMSDLQSNNGVFFNIGANSKNVKIIIGSEVTRIPANMFFPTGTYGASEHKITSVVFVENSRCEYIGAYAFHYCSLSSLYIPTSVKTIGNNAFGVNENLTVVEIGNGITNIGGNAFYYCLNLKDIIFNGSIEEWKAINKDSAWDNTTKEYVIYCINGELQKDGVAIYYPVPSEGLSYSLNADGDSYSVTGIGSCADRDVVIPRKYNNLPVTSIGDKAFYYCKQLKSITIPEGINKIGSYAFYYCSSLESIEIPSSVTDISNYAFGYCQSLASVTLSQNLKRINDYTFYKCNSLKSVVIPDSVISIGDWAFRYCISLTSVKIGDGVSSIGDWGFGDCTSLQELIIGNGLTKITSRAFKGSNAFTKVVIGRKVIAIDSYVFWECSSLKYVYYVGSEEEWAKITISDYNIYLTNAFISYNYTP